MKKVLYIVPGFTENVDSRKGYKAIEKIFKSRGFLVRQVPIRWKYGTMFTYSKELEAYVGKYHKNNEQVYLLGFSFGAMASLLVAKNVKAKAIILCSLSPFFKQDLKLIPKEWHTREGKVLDRRRLESFRKIDFNRVVKDFRIKTFILYGSKEHKLCVRRAKETHKKIKQSELIPVKNAPHDIDHKNYLTAIKKLSKSL